MITVKSIFLENIKLIVGIGVILITTLTCFFLFGNFQKEDLKINPLLAFAEEVDLSTNEEKRAYVTFDIKGAVTNPGVYTLPNESVVNDAIEIAGGLKNTASTSTINLSKTITNEMVIIIYTKNELKKQSSINGGNTSQSTSAKITQECFCPQVDISECVESNATIVDSSLNNSTGTETKNSADMSSSSSNDKLISINTASKEELTRLTGIGDSKATNIIAYREEHGLYKSVDEIMNVSGIGASIFASIKDYITV